MSPLTPLACLARLGQSIWYDNIDRTLLDAGGLKELVATGIRGVTSNPSIFHQAIVHSEAYDPTIAVHAWRHRSPREIYEALALDDIARAADQLIPVFEETGGRDGFVSLEVDPGLAHDEQGTIVEARRLFEALGRPNVMIKVPATKAGVRAQEALIADGVNVNVTLIFSAEQYAQVAEAFVRGLERRQVAGEALGAVASVASMFVSRVDRAVDAALDQLGVIGLQGKIAIANAKIAYARFEEIFSGDRWERLASGGAHEQRPLWASTGTKNPSYPDTLYVDSLIGPRTVNTVPPSTLSAFLDHGATEETLRVRRDAARRELEQLARHGIHLEEVAAQLQAEGLEAFDQAFHALLDGISTKATQLRGRWVPSKPQLGEIDRSVEEALQEIHARKVVSRIWAHDHTVWSDSEREISDRLGWLSVADALRGEVRALDRFAAEVHEAGFRDALLLGMGGSSLAPEVFAKVFGPVSSGGLSLTVLDTTDPEPIQSCSERLDPARTLVIVSTKSGTTEETLSLLRHFYHWKRRSLGKARTGEGMVAITDPGSPLQSLAEAYGFRRTFLNDPNIGGRYAALSHVGLVPAALTGMEIGRLLDRALAMADECRAKEENDAAWLGAVLAACAAQGRDKVTFSSTGAIAPFLDWVEQLIAESTGKTGQGILPVVGEPMVGWDLYGGDRVFVDLRLFGDSSDNETLRRLREAGHPVIQRWFADRYDLGREFFLWEFATAMAGHRLGIHPFNQPDVEAAKARAREAVQAYRQSGRLPEDPAHHPSGDALRTFLRQAKPGDYVALQAYVPPREDVDAALRKLRATILGTYPVATTVGYGPRFLHSTGQLHKGDGGNGLFVQIVSEAAQDLPIPDGMEDSASSISFGTLKHAQALGDAQALRSVGRRVIRFDLGGEIVAGLQAMASSLD